MEEKKKAGRPKKEFNREIFEGLCEIQCTRNEICSVLKVDVKTLYRMIKDEYGENFSTVYRKYSENGKSSLRRAQFELAKRNPTMAIWLGKQYLGQREPKQDFGIDGNMTVEKFFKDHKLDA